MSKLTFAAATVLAFAIAGPAQALEQRPVLTLAMAKTIAEACEAKAKAAGWRPINIAIYDEGANLKYFHRMDGAFLGSVQVSQLKGETSARFPRSTREYAEIAFGKDGKPGRNPGIAHVPGIAAFPGGLPIMTAAGQQLGGIGISGATSDEDEQCAQAGIDAIADMLK